MGRVRIRNVSRRSTAVPGVGVLAPGRVRVVDDSPPIRSLVAAGALSAQAVPPPAPAPDPEPDAPEEGT